jgi:hypothetical protein
MEIEVGIAPPSDEHEAFEALALTAECAGDRALIALVVEALKLKNAKYALFALDARDGGGVHLFVPLSTT